MPHFLDNIVIENQVSMFRIKREHSVVIVSGVNQVVSLTATSPYLNIIKGSFQGTVFKLPDAQTISEGQEYYLFNSANHTVTVKDFDGTELVKITKRGRVYLHLEKTVDGNDNAGTWVFSAMSASALKGTVPVLASYGGQASTGRILIIVPGIDSEEAPFPVPVDSVLIGAVISTGSGSAQTGTISIFKSGDLINSIFDISLTDEIENTVLGTEVALSALDKLSVRVTSGTIQKPYIVFYVSSI